MVNKDEIKKYIASKMPLLPKKEFIKETIKNYFIELCEGRGFFIAHIDEILEKMPTICKSKQKKVLYTYLDNAIRELQQEGSILWVALASRSEKRLNVCIIDKELMKKFYNTHKRLSLTKRYGKYSLPRSKVILGCLVDVDS